MDKTKKYFYVLCLLLFCLTLSAQQGTEPEPKKIKKKFESSKPLELPVIKNHLYYEQGEKLVFKIKYLGLTGGFATITSTPIDDNTLLFSIEAKTAKWIERVFRLRLSLISYSQKSNYQTVKYIEDKSENKRYYYNTQYFSPEEKVYTYTDRKNNDKEKRKFVSYDEIVEGGVSVPAAFFFIRSQKLEVGESYLLPCIFKDSAYAVPVNVLERDTINTKFGRQKVVAVQPLLRFDGLLDEQKDMVIYLSDDEYRIPFLMVSYTPYGKIFAYLIEGYPANLN